LELQARELVLEIDDALRDLQESYKALSRKRGFQSAAEPLNGTTARFKSNGGKLSDTMTGSAFAPLFILQSMGYGWRVDNGAIPKPPPRFEPGEGDVVGTWLAPPTSGWTFVGVRKVE